MGSLIHVVMFVGALIAFTAWSVAALCAFNIAGLAPKGEKLTACSDLGYWKFAQLETRFGPAVAPHLIRYRRAILVFMATICAMLVLSLSTLFLKPA